MRTRTFGAALAVHNADVQSWQSTALALDEEIVVV
jgi:hypothetical protein